VTRLYRRTRREPKRGTHQEQKDTERTEAKAGSEKNKTESVTVVTVAVTPKGKTEKRGGGKPRDCGKEEDRECGYVSRNTRPRAI
jgi:hypothetical protein